MELFFGNQYPTTNVFFPQMCKIKLVLDQWLCREDIDVKLLASRMLENFDNYWSNINGILSIAIVLDPRYKLKLLQFYFPQIYGGRSRKRLKGLKPTIMSCLTNTKALGLSLVDLHIA